MEISLSNCFLFFFLQYGIATIEYEIVGGGKFDKV